MARSDRAGRSGPWPRGAAVFVAIGVLHTGCKKPARTAALPTVLPTEVAAPTADPDLGTRPRIVPFEPLPIDPEGLRVLAANFDKPSVEPDDRAPALTKEALEDTALGEARGLPLDGEIHAAKLGETERVTLPIEAAPGDCLTVIAHGSLGVMEIDAFVVRRGTSRALAQDSRNGPIAVVGGIAGCWPFIESPTTKLDVVVQARKGSGRVVYAVYASRAADVADDAPER